MPMIDVPREQWSELCQKVTRERHGRSVTVEVRRPAPAELAGDFAIERAPIGEIVARDVPLVEVLLEGVDGSSQVVVAVSDDDAHRYVIPEPARIRFDGDAIAIESTNHRLTLVRFAEN